jgi:general secretion pathway protein F
VTSVQFRIKAMTSSGAVRVWAMHAADETEARRQVVGQGLQVLSLAAAKTWRRQPSAGRIALVNFSQELVALLDAGLSIVEAVDTLAEKESNPGVRRALEQIRSRLFEGQAFSVALAELPASFPPLYVATIRASERTGAIQEALTRYVAYQQKIDLLRKTLVNASIYPAVLAVTGLLVAVFLMTYVVPRFSVVYQDLGTQLPLGSRLLMEWGHLLDAHGLAVLTVAVAAAAALGYAVTRPATRAAAGRLVVRVPTVGHHLRLYQLARFYRTAGMLLRGGMPIVRAFEMSSGLLSPALRPALSGVTRVIRDGQAISASLERFDLTTPVAVRMLRVGERSGNIGEMMERVATFYDDELSRWVDIATRLIEPLLMAVLGLVIGGIVVLMYFPIFELAGSLQ